MVNTEQKQIYTNMSYYKVDPKPTCSQDTERFKTIPDCLRYYSETKTASEAFIFAYADGSREAVMFK